MRCDTCGMDLSLLDLVEAVDHQTVCFEEMMSEADVSYERIKMNSWWEQQ